MPLEVAVRRDDWWVKPLLTVLGLGAFTVYATLRALENANFEAGPYLSPFYSPHIETGWKLGGWTISPAFYILIFPLAFRATCYYYRQAYYRSFFRDPVACAVPEPASRRYTGEQVFPFILQNAHRYALYAALVILVVLWYDALRAFFFDGRFGMGLGTLIMVANCVLLSGYTFGCHSFRHLVGGKKNCFSCPNAAGELQVGTAYGCWRGVTRLNQSHMQWAWTSLGSVVVTDLYIRLIATGALQDLRFF